MGLKEQNKLKIELYGAGIPGPRGLKGDEGAPGRSFTFDDLTPDQKEQLRGPRGEKGDPGSNMSQAWVDEVTQTTQKNKSDIKELQSKDEQIAIAFEEVYELIGELDIDDLQFSKSEIKTVTNTIRKVHQKIKTIEGSILNNQQKILNLENTIENSSHLVNDEILITTDATDKNAKVIIETKDDVSNIILEKEKVLKLSSDKILHTDENEDGVEELLELASIIRNNKEEFKLIKGLIGDLSELSTDNKQNLMESINEVCAIAHNAVSRIEFDKINNKINVYNYHGLADEIDMDSSYLEN